MRITASSRESTYVTTAALTAAAAQIADRYSWGLANPPVGLIGAPDPPLYTWQFVFAICSVSLLVATAISVWRSPVAARRIAWGESALFLLGGTATILRDGSARYIRLESEPYELLGAALLALGLALRAVILSRTRVLGRSSS